MSKFVEQNYPIVLGAFSSIFIKYYFEEYNILFCIDYAIEFLLFFFFGIMISVYVSYYYNVKNSENPFMKGMHESGAATLFNWYIVKNLFCCLISGVFWNNIDYGVSFIDWYDSFLLFMTCCSFFTTWRILYLFFVIRSYAKKI